MKDKWTPATILAFHNGKAGIFPVDTVKAFPPNQHPAKCPIKDDMTAVQLISSCGPSRWYGFEKAWIDSHLRMRVSGYDPRFEEVSKWQDAKP